MLQPVVKIHVIVSSCVLLASLFYDASSQTVSILFGCSVVGINLLLMVWAWGRIIFKKSIALAVGVIVSKYAFLAFVIFFAFKSELLNPFGFFVGLTTILPSVVLWGVTQNPNRKSVIV